MCTSPLKGWQKGLTENGKKDLIITPYNIDHIEFNDSGKRIYSIDKRVYFPANAITEFIEIPCGQCIECRLARSRQWANRCMLELPYHNQSWFVTLTYDNEHIPTNDRIDHETGEIVKVGTLVKKDFQDFMKRLRRYYEYSGHDNKLRYYACGEYGSTTMRPHFHAIIFGLELDSDDLSLYKKNFAGDTLYNSKLVDKAWNQGFAVLGNVTWDSCAYTARYIMKKHLGKDSDFYADNNIAPEFTCMSTHPGIARQYYDDHKNELFMYDMVHIGNENESREIRPPRYYEKLFEDDFPESDVLARKERIKDDIAVQKLLRLEKTSLNYVDYLKQREYNLIKKNDRLVRKEI